MCLLEADAHACLTAKIIERNMMTRREYVGQCRHGQNILEEINKSSDIKGSQSINLCLLRKQAYR